MNMLPHLFAIPDTSLFLATAAGITGITHFKQPSFSLLLTRSLPSYYVTSYFVIRRPTPLPTLSDDLVRFTILLRNSKYSPGSFQRNKLQKIALNPLLQIY